MARETNSGFIQGPYEQDLSTFQTYENLDLRKIDLRKLDFTGDKLKFIRMDGDMQSVKDVTEHSQVVCSLHRPDEIHR